MYDWSQHIIGEDASLVDALEQLNKLSGQTMVLFVVDADGKMTGTLTDGDIITIGAATLIVHIPDKEP